MAYKEYKGFDKPEIGKLWVNKYREGRASVISGEINGEAVLILFNRLKFKQKKGAPDYKVFSCDKSLEDYRDETDEFNPNTEIDIIASEDEFNF